MNIINTKTNSIIESEDICQEVFFRLYSKLDEIDNYKKWLFGAMKNVLFEYYKKKSKNENIDIDTAFNEEALTFVNGIKETRLIIEEALENVLLDDVERLILDYISFQNYSYSNVGKIMNLSKGQIKYKYSKIVQKILTFLKSKGINNLEELL